MIEIDTVESTNSLMKERLDTLPHGTVIQAREQTAGRGQRGNTWEAEPGMNVTMSLLLKDLPVEPRRQFAISEAVALAVADAVARRLPPALASHVAVKWPNDIYVDDRKIAGILIECGIRGAELTYAVAGIGLNINQTIFRSDAPNPVSLRQLAPSAEFGSIASIACGIATEIVDSLSPPSFDVDALHGRYLARLWRREGEHRWRRRDDGRVFTAPVTGVSPEGFLSLGSEGTFLFKEVEALL